MATACRGTGSVGPMVVIIGHSRYTHNLFSRIGMVVSLITVEN